MSWQLPTRLARTGINSDPGHGGVVAPISVSATYRRSDPRTPGAFDYARTQNPSRSIIEAALADLEGAAGASVTASGMAAIDVVINDLPIGARIVCAHDVYGGTRRLFDARAAGGRLEISYMDMTTVEGLEAALSRPAALVFLETPSNPRLRVTDLEKACAAIRKAGAISVVDNTVLTGILQRPLSCGADIVVASITKLLNGHSDMVGGMVACADAQCAARIAWWINAAGTGAGAFDSFLGARGLRTLKLRAEAQSATALELARRLSQSPQVRRVDYPGLPSHPGHAIAARQQSGFGPLLSLELAHSGDAAVSFVKRLQLFTLGQSLGGVESLSCLPACMTHAAMTEEARREAGISDGLIRLSVGLEDMEDLWADLEIALNA